MNEKTFWLPRSRPKSPYSTLPLSQRAPNAYKKKKTLSSDSPTILNLFLLFTTAKAYSRTFFHFSKSNFRFETIPFNCTEKILTFFSSNEIALGRFFFPSPNGWMLHDMFSFDIRCVALIIGLTPGVKAESRVEGGWNKRRRRVQSIVDNDGAGDRLIRALSVFVQIDRKNREKNTTKKERKDGNRETRAGEALHTAIETIYWSFQSRRYHMKWLNCILVARSWRPLINSLFFDIEQIRHVEGTKDDDETFNEYFISAQKELSWIRKEKKACVHEKL